MLILSDGHAGLRKAIELWPEAQVQRCTWHKGQNLVSHCPAHARQELKRDYDAIVYAEDGMAGPETARVQAAVQAKARADARTRAEAKAPPQPKPKTPATNPRSYYVTADLNVRLAPSADAKITNRLHRQDRVDALEVRDGWARISRHYDGRVEGLSGTVARWVSTSHLSKRRPADLPQPKLPHDSRINGLPKVGQGGLTERDVLILYRGAKHFLDSGRCDRIEWADKSVNKPGTYYVNCGRPGNLHFKPSDLPRG